MKRFLASIAILLASVWIVSAQQLFFITNTDIQQKGDYNSVYKSHNPDKDYPMGCMATAMTIIMDYHKSPVTYNYDTVTGTNGLSQLMYDAAESINTQYGENESSAALSEVAVQLVNKFGYDSNSVKYYLRASSGMNDQEWIALIVRNINNGMPVIYSAGTQPAVTNSEAASSSLNYSERHAFVIDGIQRDTKAPYGYLFHINGGQGMHIYGNSQWVDNIFSVTIGDKTYSDTPEMVCGIRTAAQARADVSSLKLVSYEGSYGLSMSVSSIVSGQPFNVTAASLQNWSDDGKAFSGYIFPVLVRTDNNGQLVITQPDNTLEIAKHFDSADGFTYRRTLSTLTLSGVTFTVPAGVDLGNYSLRLATADNINNGSRKLDIKLIEPLAGESPDLITSLPAINNGIVKVKFETASTGGVVLQKRVITSTSLTYETISETEQELTYGTPFLFFAKRTSSVVSDNEVILSVNGKKYLMKDYFASKNFANLFDGAFYITPTEPITIQAQLIDKSQLYNNVSVDLTGKAGSLADVINGKNINPCYIGGLTVTGDMNSDDFYYIRDNMPMLETLDMSAVNIIANGSHPANTIPEAAFYKEIYNSDGYTLALKTVYLPNSCTTIGSNAFMYCSKLEEVHIPKNVKKINYNVFYSCRNLKSVYVYNPVPCFVNWCVFKNISDGSVLYVPKGSKNLYVGEENANRIPGTIYTINEWYNRWHDGSTQGKCVEMGDDAQGQMKVQLMRTSFVSFNDGGKKPGSAIWTDNTYKVMPSISSPVSSTMWKLRALVSYAENGQNKDEYVYGTVSNDVYSFDLTALLNTLKGKGIKEANVKIDVYLNVTEAVEERLAKGQNYFYPYIYDGMEVTLTGGWTKSNSSEVLDLDGFYFGLRSGYATNLPKAKAVITLDNARIGSIQTGTVDMDIVLKNNNEMAGLYYSKFESFLIDNGHTVSLQGNGTLTLANDTYDSDNEICGPRAYSTAGGVLNMQHGITVNNLENMTFENIKITYTRTFDRVIKSSDGTTGFGWETLSLPFTVIRIEKANGRQMSWATPTKTGDFWLREMTDNAKQLTFSSDVDSIRAGHSYIISVPDEGKNSLIGIPLTFVGPTIIKGATLINKSDFVTPNYNSGGLNVDMTPYPYTFELPSTYYVMNRNGGSFYKWDESSSIEDANLVTLRQFEAYFEPKDLTSTMFKAFSLKGDVVKEETTGVNSVTNNTDLGYTIYSENGSLVVKSDGARMINVSTVDGRTYSYNIKYGTTRISMPAGVYIIGGKKVLVNK